MSSPSADTASPNSSTSPSRKRATIARLLKEARRAFSAHGLAGARIDDIARAAGVTKQLVYHYFTSKEALFASVLDESAQDVLADLLALELDHLPPVDGLRVLLRHGFDQYRRDPTLGSLAQESLRFHEHHACATQRNRFVDLAPALVAQMERILLRGIASGDFRSGVDARMFYAASALLTTGGFTNHYTVSAVAGFDTTSADGAVAWREYSIDFVLSTVLAHERPPLTRPRAPSSRSADAPRAEDGGHDA
ncbi:bacterial regulatory s, tetR family protein [Paraburkholderia xenovorans LB400]|uniref:Transcriptional regulator, TetR family n=1 Tax=Paraburkholderia xenovorans (strain LB400) TaxID=266265 RepID=Q13HA5_PARXL|nr:TetR/AcrR family transcriptional regulator [Paraburkholderia xenovorans]ABE36534.1 transcriptional regulator, TetR family [Paraburkholderia xenovorans LB400]AIP34504.1 bacterial regulatory s, tetR family protein [Paraburkholderia xenovorans LB400]